MKIQKFRELDQTWYKCPHCDFKARDRELIDHLANNHNLGVEWHECPHCDYKASILFALKNHLAHEHDVGVTWYECPFDEYKAKKREALIRHITKHHDIIKMWGECPHCVGTSEDRSLECRQIWDEIIKALKEKFEYNET